MAGEDQSIDCRETSTYPPSVDLVKSTSSILNCPAWTAVFSDGLGAHLDVLGDHGRVNVFP
jgi:hypothetical protein